MGKTSSFSDGSPVWSSIFPSSPLLWGIAGGRKRGQKQRGQQGVGTTGRGQHSLRGAVLGADENTKEEPVYPWGADFTWGDFLTPGSHIKGRLLNLYTHLWPRTWIMTWNVLDRHSLVGIIAGQSNQSFSQSFSRSVNQSVTQSLPKSSS